MGKHSFPGRGRFWGSVLYAMATWAGLASLPVLGGWGLWSLLHTPENPPSPAVVRRPGSEVANPAPSSFDLVSPFPLTPSTPEPLASEDPPSPTPPALAGELASITLQVLNGSGSERAAARAAGVLRDAGCRVVATLPARERYPATVILYQPGSHTPAERVAKLLGLPAAGRLRPAPPGLDRSVAVTVVIGADYRG